MINLSYFVTRPIWKSHGLGQVGQVFPALPGPTKMPLRSPGTIAAACSAALPTLETANGRDMKVTQTRQAAVTQLGVRNSSSKTSE